jgi:hypothetical protein
VPFFFGWVSNGKAHPVSSVLVTRLVRRGLCQTARLVLDQMLQQGNAFLLSLTLNSGDITTS